MPFNVRRMSSAVYPAGKSTSHFTSALPSARRVTRTLHGGHPLLQQAAHLRRIALRLAQFQDNGARTLGLDQGDERWRITWKRTISTVATPPVTYSPAPTAMPTPTVAHRPAAVVTPLTVRPWVKMTPTPKKPMAVTTPAATREASREIPPGR